MSISQQYLKRELLDNLKVSKYYSNTQDSYFKQISVISSYLLNGRGYNPMGIFVVVPFPAVNIMPDAN